MTAFFSRGLPPTPIRRYASVSVRPDLDSVLEMEDCFDGRYYVEDLIYESRYESVFDGLDIRTNAAVIIKQSLSNKNLYCRLNKLFNILQQDEEENFSGFENIKHIKHESIKLTVSGFIKSCCSNNESEFEDNSINIPSLVYFLCIHYYYRPSVNIQTLKYHKEYVDQAILIMDKCGVSLQDLLDKNINGKFKLQSILLLADQMISTLQYIHDKGFIHRNFAKCIINRI